MCWPGKDSQTNAAKSQEIRATGYYSYKNIICCQNKAYIVSIWHEINGYLAGHKSYQLLVITILHHPTWYLSSDQYEEEEPIVHDRNPLYYLNSHVTELYRRNNFCVISDNRHVLLYRAACQESCLIIWDEGSSCIWMFTERKSVLQWSIMHYESVEHMWLSE